ncbi:vacuolar import and degradation protein-domain-containing protein [Ampelomyces quisqualis]|uniref:Vacuolar import and degradation protein-domain-containing protein n=1 Tax=Ampelomyces quisqualis TaxID=50730 RepID=A0A6A5QTH3_AMPQU|nr:vacuolar import and degradation protein-domain-containing protein [Ampelomyces quisqualis]
MPPANSPDEDPPLSFITALRELENAGDEDVLNLASTLGTPTPSAAQMRHELLRDDSEQRDRLRRVMSRLSRVDDGTTAAYGDRVPSANSLYDWSPATDDGRSQLESLRSAAILQTVRRHPRFSARSRDYLQRSSGERDVQGRHLSESARQMAMQRLAASENRHADRRDAHPTATCPPVASPLLEQTVKYLSRIRHSDTIDDTLNHALDAGFLSKDYFCIQYADFLTDTAAIPPPAETSWLAPGAVLSGCQHATSAPATVPTPALAPPSRPWLASSHSTPRSRSAYLSPEATSPPHPPQDRWPVKVTIHQVDWDTMSLSATMEAYNVPSHPHANPAPLHPDSTPYQQQYTRTSSITTYLEGEILDFNTHTLLTESFKSTAATDATYWRKLPPFASMTDQEVVKALTSKKWFDTVLRREYILMRWKERCFVKSLNRSTPDPLPNSHLHHLADTPYRLVRHPETNALQVEISAGNDTEHATFDDSGCGLTISGFYYAVMKRADGSVQGLYFDPQSSPYQCLELGSRNGGRGAWSFR